MIKSKTILLEYLKRMGKLYALISFVVIALSPIYLISKNLLLYLIVLDSTLIMILPYTIYSFVAPLLNERWQR